MGQRLPGFPELPQHTMTIVLDGSEFRFRFTYRTRAGAWYVDMFTAADVPLAVGRRVSAAWGPFVGLSLPDGPTSIVVVAGREPYEKLELGDALALVAYTIAELEALDTTVEPDPVLVVIT